MKSLFFLGLLTCILWNRSINHETSSVNESKSFDPLELSIKLMTRHRNLNCIQFVKDRTQHTLIYLALLMLTISSDIESNPGPRTPKYPCQVCTRAVTWKDRGVACDDCRIYVCSNCGNELFHSQTKYEHSSPWPAFTHLIREDSVTRVKESSTAIKISCSKCGNGLGHEFLGDGPKKGMNRY